MDLGIFTWENNNYNIVKVMNTIVFMALTPC